MKIVIVSESGDADAGRSEYSQKWFAVSLATMALLYVIAESQIGAWDAVIRALSGINASSGELMFAALLSSIIVFVLPLAVMFSVSFWIARVKYLHALRSR